jgi:SAM-dependent methyltransferase
MNEVTNITVQEVADWFLRDRRPALSKTSAVEFMHSSHPRTLFLKSLPRRAQVLDMGAGDGSLAMIKTWPAPQRSDLELYAVSLEKGAHFDRYARFELGNWEESRPGFDGMMFAAIMSSHFIEHIHEPQGFVEWAATRLKDGGRLYVEWPTPVSQSLPSRETLERAGVRLIISSFFDDSTHLRIPPREDVVRWLRELGLTVEQQGVVRNPFLEEELLAHFRDNKEDEYAVQFAYWSWTSWAQFVIAEKSAA